MAKEAADRGEGIAHDAADRGADMTKQAAGKVPAQMTDAGVSQEANACLEHHVKR